MNFSTQLEKAIVAIWNGETKWHWDINDAIETAKGVVEWLKEQGVTGTAEYAGVKNYTTTKEWKEAGGPARSTSKTDFIIGNHKFSLKVGDSKLMSGAKPDATAIFTTLISRMTNPDPNRVNKIMALIESFISGVCNDTVRRAKKTDKALQEGTKLHERLARILEGMLDDNDEFTTAFVREAITGELKFGKGSPAVPTHLLTVEGEDYILYDLSDESVFERLAQLVDIRVSFKSSHLKGTSKTAYRYYSVISMTLKKLEESITAQRHDMLSEEVVSDLWNKIKGFFMKLMSDVKDFVSVNWKNLIDFLELEPEITINE